MSKLKLVSVPRRCPGEDRRLAVIYEFTTRGINHLKGFPIPGFWGWIAAPI